MDLEMKIQPKFLDEECAIVFSFYFNNKKNKIGEATIYTYEDRDYQPALNEKLTGTKVAFVKQISIIEEYRAHSFEKIKEFLQVLGIKDLYSDEIPLSYNFS